MTQWVTQWLININIVPLPKNRAPLGYHQVDCDGDTPLRHAVNVNNGNQKERTLKSKIEALGGDPDRNPSEESSCLIM